MKAALAPDFSTVTEQPGLPASALQRAMLEARYAWAVEQARAKDVLEVACGAGLGLEALARVARKIRAGDLDAANTALAERAAAGLANTLVEKFDALDLPYPESSFDLVLLFESIYYLADLPRFFSEARRVLRSGGKLLITTVNPEWGGFHPSPFHSRYLSALGLRKALVEAGFSSRVRAAFPENTASSYLLNLIRRAASRTRLMPRTMRGKTALKRMVFGRLTPLPARLSSPRPASLTPIEHLKTLAHHRVLYVEASRS